MKKIIFLLTLLVVFSGSAFSDTKPNSVYFDELALDPILTLISQAQSSIYIQMYNFTNQHEDGQLYSDVIQCLLNKLTENPDKKIELKIIIDNQGANRPPEKGGKEYGFPEAVFEGITADCIKWDSKPTTMHRKVAVVDGSEVFIGSTNWTNNGFNVNREIDVLLHDPEIAS